MEIRSGRCGLLVGQIKLTLFDHGDNMDATLKFQKKSRVARGRFPLQKGTPDDSGASSHLQGAIGGECQRGPLSLPDRKG
jgi:hypothetical protein